MIVAKYQGFEIIHVYGLTQYDYGQILHIENIDISEDTEIHFCQGNKAITQYIKDNQVAIPDYLLQYSQQINAYIYLIEGSAGKTIIKIIFPIKSRERPGDYVTPEEPAYSRLLPSGGLPGQILTRGPTGYIWINPEQGQEATELEVVEMMEKIFGGVI